MQRVKANEESGEKSGQRNPKGYPTPKSSQDETRLKQRNSGYPQKSDGKHYPSKGKSGSYGKTGYPHSKGRTGSASATSRKEAEEQQKIERKRKIRNSHFSHIVYMLTGGVFLSIAAAVFIIYSTRNHENAYGSAYQESLEKVVWRKDDFKMPYPMLTKTLEFRQSPARVSVMGPFRRCNKVAKTIIWTQLTSVVTRAAELSMYCGKEELKGKVNGYTLIGVENDIKTDVIASAFSSGSSAEEAMQKLRTAARLVPEDTYRYSTATIEQRTEQCAKWEETKGKKGAVWVKMDRLCEFHRATIATHTNMTTRKTRLDEILELYQVKINDTSKNVWLDTVLTKEQKEQFDVESNSNATIRLLQFQEVQLSIVRPPAPSLAFVAEYIVRLTIECVTVTRPHIDYRYVVPVCFAEAQKSAWIRAKDGSIKDATSVDEMTKMAKVDAKIVEQKHFYGVSDTRELPTFNAQPSMCTLVSAMQKAENTFGAIFRRMAAACMHVEIKEQFNYTYASPIFLFSARQCIVATTASGGFQTVAGTAAVLVTRLYSENINTEVIFPIYNVTGEPRWVIDKTTPHEKVLDLGKWLGVTLQPIIESDYKTHSREDLISKDPNFREVYIVFATEMKVTTEPMKNEEVYVQRCNGCISADQTGF
ncbi:unnamed protein product, partial [Mesorhabditis belari]|uniref:Uncharacterized protein n=1 Tax=Mesorhabditis belari TaxID=2138241 RepID=A0AAF3F6X1_9BILA